MKVILAGLPKTGLTSMVDALEQLDFTVYHYVRHYTEHADEWNKILQVGCSSEQLRRMYEDVDAVSDFPVCYYWEEIHKAFPEAKIILTVRNDEDVWFKSYENQHRLWEMPYLRSLQRLSISFRKFHVFEESIMRYIFGHPRQGILDTLLFRPSLLNEFHCKKSYRRHNSYIMQIAPKDKLLVFNVKEGWAPLCKFLGAEVPSSPFPHKNTKGVEVEDFMQHDPFYAQIRNEMIFSVSIFVVLMAMCYGVLCAFTT